MTLSKIQNDSEKDFANTAISRSQKKMRLAHWKYHSVLWLSVWPPVCH